MDFSRPTVHPPGLSHSPSSRPAPPLQPGQSAGLPLLTEPVTKLNTSSSTPTPPQALLTRARVCVCVSVLCVCLCVCAHARMGAVSCNVSLSAPPPKGSFLYHSFLDTLFSSLKNVCVPQRDTLLCMCARSLQLCPTLCDPHGLQPTKLLCPWDSPGKNTAVGCHALLQGFFPTQGLDPQHARFPNCRHSLQLSH